MAYCKDPEILFDALIESNEIIRSAYSIFERKGENTNWDAFGKKLTNILVKQKLLMDGYYVDKANELSKNLEVT